MQLLGGNLLLKARLDVENRAMNHIDILVVVVNHLLCHPSSHLNVIASVVTLYFVLVLHYKTISGEMLGCGMRKRKVNSKTDIN